MRDEVFPKSESQPNADRATGHPGWDARSEGRLTPGIAVSVRPGSERIAEARKEAPGSCLDEERVRPGRWTPEWREALWDQVAVAEAGRQLPGACFPAPGVPRFVHGQSQGICDLFGARVELQADGNYFVHPLPPDPAAIDAVAPRPIETSMYWGAVEWVRYAHAASRGRFAFRNPVMTSSFDTANYLLGTTVLMEWVNTEPAALHRLLDKVTETIIAMLRALREAAGGVLHGDALGCMRNAFCLCSECRSLVAAATFEEFEAQYLRRIGQELGAYAIHSCGSWERTVPSSIRDPNLRAMDGQVRENDLAALCALARGRVMLNIAPSRNLNERYTWPDTRSFLEYILRTTPVGQPLEVAVAESDLALWHELYAGIKEERHACA